MDSVSDNVFLKKFLEAERPGAERVLAFYDSTSDAICRNGRYLFIPLSDHLCHRGDALFESLCVSDGYIFALDGHLERLKKGSTSFMQLPPPCTWEQVKQHIIDVARAAGEKSCALRLFLGRGAGGFGIDPRESPKSSLYIVALRQEPVSPEVYAKGMTAFTSRIPPKQSYLATVKNTNYLPNVLMAREAIERGMDVAVTFHEDGTMGEAAVANVGIVNQAGELICPPLDRILAGTSMLCAMKVASGKIPVHYENITKDDILAAREMLLFASSKLCVGITHFDGRPVGCGRPGPVAHWLFEAMHADMIATGVLI